MAGIRAWQQEQRRRARERGAIPTVPRRDAPRWREPLEPDHKVARLPVVLLDSLPDDARRVCELVCADFGLRLEDLTGRRRQRELCVPRHVACYLMQRVLGVGSTRAGRLLGGFDHCTVVKGVARTEQRMQEDREFRDRVRWLREQLLGSTT